MEVAFSKNTQPLWFRITKYALLGTLVYFTRTKPFFWWMISALFVFSSLFILSTVTKQRDGPKVMEGGAMRSSQAINN